MYERALELAADELRERRRRVVQTALLGTAAAAGAGVALPFSAPLAIALGTGALLEIFSALAAAYGRRQLVERLALHPAAYVLPEVAAYGAAAVRPSQRARLASWLVELVADAGAPQSLYLGERVRLVADELEALARELASPARSIEPSSAVACQRLLTHMAESPLYNPVVPVEDLHVSLRRIRAGIA